MNRLIGVRLVQWAVSLLFVAIAVSQVTDGVIMGIVTDPAGRAVANAKVTVQNLGTNALREATTDATGLFRVTQLPPASYDVRIEAAGFKAAVAKDTVLTVAETKRLDVALALGTVAETVNVTEEARPVDTEVGSLSTLVQQQQIVQLPLDGRNIYQLILLSPGAANMNQSDLQTTSPAVNGQRPRGNNFMLDGVSNNFDFLTGEPVITPNVDSVQEFRILTNNFSAEYGRNSGSIINVVTKSGTNQLHGNLWEFHRNGAFGAKDFFAPTKPRFIRNQFGGTVGGPIIKDRTFFFGSYEGLRSVFGRSQLLTVETPQLRDFAITRFPGSVAAYLYKNFPAPVPTSNLRDIGTPVRGPLFQSAANDPTVVSNPNYVLQPSGLYLNRAQTILDGVPDVGDVNVSISDNIRNDQYSGRIDHQFNGGKDQLYGRFYLTDFNQPKFLPAYRGPFDTALLRRLQNYGIAETHVFSSRVVNEARLGFVRDREFWNPANPGVPLINVDSPVVSAYGASLTWPRLVVTNAYQYLDVLTIMRGRHGFKIGGEVRRVQENGNWYITRGNYLFFDPLDFAQDEPYGLVEGINPQKLRIASNPVELRNTEGAAFFQDDWKVTPRLTLNLGLRYEVFGRIKDRLGHLGNVQLPSGGNFLDPAAIAASTVGSVGSVATPDRNDFAPRLGFAWDVFGNGKTSLRGGYGVAYNKVFNNAIGVARLNPPFFSYSVILPYVTASQAGIPLVYGPTNGGPVSATGPNNNLGTDAGSGLIGNITGYNPAFGYGRQNLRAVDPNLRDPYAENWFIGIQQQLGGHWVGELAYAGSVGHRLEMRVDVNAFNGDLLDGQLNRLNPQFNKVNMLTNLGASSYNSLQAKLSRRLGQGLLAEGSYTFSKTLDNSSDIWGPLGEGENLDVAMDTRALFLQKGLSTLDGRHRAVVFLLYDLPGFRKNSGWTNRVLGGWQVNTLVQLQSGLPFTVFCQASFPTCDWNANGDPNDRPNTPAFGNSLSGLSRSDYVKGIFKASDFPAPARGTNGNLGRNTFRGPGQATVDFSLLKNFRFTDRWNLQFRAEAFNLFNRVNLTQVRGDMASGSFGKSVGSFPARQGQLALKLSF